jgi:hypothetical protein
MAIKVANPKDERSTYWIGVNDKQTEGSFVYESNGTPISFTPKFVIGLGSQGTHYNCILLRTFLYPRPDQVEWFDMSCRWLSRSICEKTN